MVPSLAIHDTMRHIKSDVGTVGFGGCMGMSGFLLAVGKKVSSCCPKPRLEWTAASRRMLRACREDEARSRNCLSRPPLSALVCTAGQAVRAAEHAHHGAPPQRRSARPGAGGSALFVSPCLYKSRVQDRKAESHATPATVLHAERDVTSHRCTAAAAPRRRRTSTARPRSCCASATTWTPSWPRPRASRLRRRVRGCLGWFNGRLFTAATAALRIAMNLEARATCLRGYLPSWLNSAARVPFGSQSGRHLLLHPALLRSQVAADFSRNKYFDTEEAQDYGLIDQVSSCFLWCPAVFGSKRSRAQRADCGQVVVIIPALRSWICDAD